MIDKYMPGTKRIQITGRGEPEVKTSSKFDKH